MDITEFRERTFTVKMTENEMANLVMVLGNSAPKNVDDNAKMYLEGNRLYDPGHPMTHAVKHYTPGKTFDLYEAFSAFFRGPEAV